MECGPADINRAAKLLADGKLVAFPTETVYGLGADALNAQAAADIYTAKGRPSDNPMIVHIAEKEDLGILTERITDDMRSLMTAFWPGPLTMVLPAKDVVPRVTTGGLPTVAVRMPAHPVARALIRAAGVPIAAPSANTSGRPSPTRWQHVYEDLNGRIDAILMGEPCEIGIESTVVDMTTDPPVLLRPGFLTPRDLSIVLGKEVLLDPALRVHPPGQPAHAEAPGAAAVGAARSAATDRTVGAGTAQAVKASGRAAGAESAEDAAAVAAAAQPAVTPAAGTTETPRTGEAAAALLDGCGDFHPRSPGMKYRHYAPKADMYIFRGKPEAVRQAIAEAKLARMEKGESVGVILYDDADPLEAARHLFDQLRAFDRAGVDIIFAGALQEEGVGLAVMNRMFKSAGYHIIDV